MLEACSKSEGYQIRVGLSRFSLAQGVVGAATFIGFVLATFRKSRLLTTEFPEMPSRLSRSTTTVRCAQLTACRTG
jgi:hypothetical protein